jgi:hypothetical protein
MADERERDVIYRRSSNWNLWQLGPSAPRGAKAVEVDIASLPPIVWIDKSSGQEPVLGKTLKRANEIYPRSHSR